MNIVFFVKVISYYTQNMKIWVILLTRTYQKWLRSRPIANRRESCERSKRDDAISHETL